MTDQIGETPSVEANTQPAELTVEAPAIPEKFGGDVNKLVESYNSLESKMGSMYSMPTEDSSAERWQEFEQRVTGTGKFLVRPDSENKEQLDQFYNQLGRPETADAYNVQIADEVKPYVDDNMYNSYTKIAYDNGLTNSQAQALMDYEIDRMSAQAEQQLQYQRDAEQQLRQTWGSDYDNRMAGAKSAAAVYSEKYPDAVQELLNGPSGNNPALISMLAELGSSLRESGHVGMTSAPQYGTSPDDAKAQIAEIRGNPNHPSRNPYDPGYKAAKLKVNNLYAIAYPDEG